MKGKGGNFLSCLIHKGMREILNIILKYYFTIILKNHP